MLDRMYTKGDEQDRRKAEEIAYAIFAYKETELDEIFFGDRWRYTLYDNDEEDVDEEDIYEEERPPVWAIEQFYNDISRGEKYIEDYAETSDEAYL
ncbi:hypothetical protein CYMTET_47674 [Cymbomonas tetramitiformis]|uniref:Uncharacterized protein n=1 Tax=Cymbomonas tetramitiformis TaxID=36881 RepID=A0AAE0BTR5_9CHLO|nr:hypothetical protein CYMTET_47674 [Cymbomonas tetramitiformis]